MLYLTIPTLSAVPYSKQVLRRFMKAKPAIFWFSPCRSHKQNIISCCWIHFSLYLPCILILFLLLISDPLPLFCSCRIADKKIIQIILDNRARQCYYKQAVRNARVVELADSLDSGSSAHSGRAGSSPASRTYTKIHENVEILMDFLFYMLFYVLFCSCFFFSDFNFFR